MISSKSSRSVGSFAQGQGGIEILSKSIHQVCDLIKFKCQRRDWAKMPTLRLLLEFLEDFY